MSTDAITDLCRITLIAPRVRLDIAVPASVPVASLLPTLLWHSGEQLAEEGAAHGGWALQRLGEPPLDTARTLAAHGVRDGDILYFRPRRASMPDVVFDDAVDAIATTLRERTHRWAPSATRQAALAAVPVLLVAGALAVLVTGPPWAPVAATGLGLGVALVLGALALSRASGDAVAATVVGTSAAPYAFAGGIAVLAGHKDLLALGAPQLVVAFGAALVVVALAAAAVGGGAPPMLAPAVVATCGLACSLIAMRCSAAGSAAAGVACVLALTPLIPRSAYRAGRLPAAVVALGAEDLRRAGEPLPSGEIGPRALLADRTITALLAGSSIAVLGGEFWMLLGAGSVWAVEALCGVAAVLLLLRARLFGGMSQRLWCLIPGMVSVALVAVRLAMARSAGVGLGVVVPVLLVAAGAAVVTAVAPERRVAPTWARTADIVELLGTVATIPLALELLGVFGYVRTLVH